MAQLIAARRTTTDKQANVARPTAYGLSFSRHRSSSSSAFAGQRLGKTHLVDIWCIKTSDLKHPVKLPKPNLYKQGITHMSASW